MTPTRETGNSGESAVMTSDRLATLPGVTGRSGKGTARQTMRIPEDEWDAFGAACARAGVDRSSYVREAIRWAIGQPGAKRPRKLPAAPAPDSPNRTEETQ